MNIINKEDEKSSHFKENIWCAEIQPKNIELFDGLNLENDYLKKKFNNFDGPSEQITKQTFSHNIRELFSHLV